MKLNPVNREKGMNRWCGPAVISSITGMTTDEAARLIRTLSGRQMVTGTSDVEMMKALSLCNVNIKCLLQFPKGKGPTLTAWLRESQAMRTAGRVFLLVSGWHWQLISGRRYVCGKTTDVVSIRDEKVKRRARVALVWEIFDGGIRIPDQAKGPTKEQRAAARQQEGAKFWTKSQLRQLQAMGEPYGITVEEDTDFLCVYPPEESCIHDDKDPFDDDHMCWSIADAMSMIKTYTDLLWNAPMPAATQEVTTSMRAQS